MGEEQGRGGGGAGEERGGAGRGGGRGGGGVGEGRGRGGGGAGEGRGEGAGDDFGTAFNGQGQVSESTSNYTGGSRTIEV